MDRNSFDEKLKQIVVELEEISIAVKTSIKKDDFEKFKEIQKFLQTVESADGAELHGEEKANFYKVKLWVAHVSEFFEAKVDERNP